MISQAEAELRRKSGDDVVVVGPNLQANRTLAQAIELNANGYAQRHPPHPSAGLNALPHYQPKFRPPAGHAFYETPNRKAV